MYNGFELCKSFKEPAFNSWDNLEPKEISDCEMDAETLAEMRWEAERDDPEIFSKEASND